MRVLSKFITDDAVTDAKVKLRNNNYLRARNAADSADVDLFKVNASDAIEAASIITMPGSATVANHLVNLGFLQNYIDGVRDMKQGVRVASTANVNISSAPSAIDGVTLSNGDRVLLKDQTAGAENGIRVFTAAAAPLLRSSDADVSAEVTQGMSCLVAEGTVNARKMFQLVTQDPIVLDTTSLVFQETPTIATYTGGDMVTVSGSVISVDLATVSGLESTNAGNAAGQLRVKVDSAAAAKDKTTKINATNDLVALKSVGEALTLSGTDITNQYVDLANVAHESSILLVVGGVPQRKAVDYTLNYTGGSGGNTRVSFAGELATAGAAALVAGDVLYISYRTL
jgi:hypothetical protein